MASSRSPIGPVRLHGNHVRLEPLSPDHLQGLAEAGADRAIWEWYPARYDTVAAMKTWCDEALALAAAGSAVPFTVFDASGSAVIGSTRFASIDGKHRRAEIGWTWYAPRAQRTAANTECKYLMLREAFERWGLIRVEFKTDSLNARSRAAIRRIGATEEGTLRNHMVTQDGRIRHSVYFSITDSEWPRVKEHLQRLLDGSAYDSVSPRGGERVGANGR